MTDYFEHIEDYMSDQLSAEQKAAFELAMESDSALRQAVADWPTAVKLSEGLLELDVLATIQGLEAAENPDEGMPRDHTKVVQIDPSSKGLATDQSYDVSRKPWLWAVLMLALGGLAVWLYQGSRSQSIRTLTSDQVYAAYYEAPVNEVTERGVDDIHTSIEKAILLYHKDLPEEAAQIFVADTTDISTSHYYLGHIALDKELYSDAAAYFNASQHVDAPYYAVLSYVLAKDYTSAKNYSTELSDVGIEAKLKSQLGQI